MFAQGAPAVLNRAGACDILSCFTALWDWQESATILGEEYDTDLARDVQRGMLDRLYSGAPMIKEQSEEGLKLLAELQCAGVTKSEEWGNARIAEGSEHYLCYALEAKTKRHYLHGALVGMCTVLAAAVQGQDPAPVVNCLRTLDVDCSFEAVGTNREELFEVLRDMGTYVTSEKLMPGVFQLHY